MPEVSFGSSFEKSKAGRPTSDQIAEKARLLLSKESAIRESGDHYSGQIIPLDEFEQWSKREPTETSEKKMRDELYPGWTREDFVELLALIEEGRRPDEESMQRSMQSFFEQKQRDGWKKEDILRAMELYKNPES